jgi:hypothetical protein
MSSVWDDLGFEVLPEYDDVDLKNFLNIRDAQPVCYICVRSGSVLGDYITWFFAFPSQILQRISDASQDRSTNDPVLSEE